MQIVSDFYGKFFRGTLFVVGGRWGVYLAKNRGKVSVDELRVFLGLSLSSRPASQIEGGGVERRNEYRSTHRFDTTFIMLSFYAVINSLYMIFVAYTQHLPCICG